MDENLSAQAEAAVPQEVPPEAPAGEAPREIYAGDSGMPREERREKMHRDVREFLEEFPDVKPADIDPEVWQEVNRGKTLVSAYRARREARLLEENRQLRERLDNETRNASNRRRSIGSQRTSGQDSGRDAFVEALLGGEYDTI